LLCEKCGAPIEALRAGGSVQCRYCNTYSAIAQRNERPVFAVQSLQCSARSSSRRCSASSCSVDRPRATIRCRSSAHLGLRAEARVLAVVPTSMSVNDLPVVKLQVSIELPGRAPYTAESKMVMRGALLARAIPGASVPVRVTPKKPNEIILELD
jgi:hypothetical protein